MRAARGQTLSPNIISCAALVKQDQSCCQTHSTSQREYKTTPINWLFQKILTNARPIGQLKVAIELTRAMYVHCEVSMRYKDTVDATYCEIVSNIASSIIE